MWHMVTLVIGLVLVILLLMVTVMAVNMNMQMMVTDKTDDKRRETGPQTILMVTSIPWANSMSCFHLY